MRKLVLLVASLSCLAGGMGALAGPAQAATLTFTGTLTSDWSIAGNWDLAQVPTSGDDVVIPIGESAVLSTADGSARQITLAPGASLTVSGARTLTLASAGVSSFGGQVAVNGQATLVLDGTTTWSAGLWLLGGGGPVPAATVSNDGALVITGDVSTSNQGGSPVLRNLAGGTITRMTSAGTASFTVGLENDGVVQVDTGTLVLGAGSGGLSSGGAFGVAGGAVLSVSGEHALGALAQVSGAGTLRLDGATFALAAGAGYSPATTLASGGFLGLAGVGSTTRLVSDGQGGGVSGVGTLAVGNGASNFDNVTFSGGGTTSFGATGTTEAG